MALLTSAPYRWHFISPPERQHEVARHLSNAWGAPIHLIPEDGCWASRVGKRKHVGTCPAERGFDGGSGDGLGALGLLGSAPPPSAQLESPSLSGGEAGERPCLSSQGDVSPLLGVHVTSCTVGPLLRLPADPGLGSDRRRSPAHSGPELRRGGPIASAHLGSLFLLRVFLSGVTPTIWILQVASTPSLEQSLKGPRWPGSLSCPGAAKKGGRDWAAGPTASLGPRAQSRGWRGARGDPPLIPGFCAGRTHPAGSGGHRRQARLPAQGRCLFLQAVTAAPTFYALPKCQVLCRVLFLCPPTEWLTRQPQEARTVTTATSR